MLKAECDIGGGLNDGMKDLQDLFVFEKDQVVASRDEFELFSRDAIGNEVFARL